MDNNSNKRNSGLIALIVIAIIVVTVIIIAVVTSNNSTDETKDTLDSIEDTAETEIDDAVSEVRDDITEIGDDISDVIFDNETETDTDTGTQASDTTETEPMTSEPDTSTAEPDQSVSLPTEFALPVTGYISKDYSIDLPVFSLTMNDYRTHSGIDISSDIGTQVAAFAEGTITDKYVDPFMGVCLEITHSGGMVSKYMNLSEEFPEGIEVGASVSCGQSIGTIGESASIEASDEPHLHFEVMLNDAHADPMDYIEADLSVDTGYEE